MSGRPAPVRGRQAFTQLTASRRRASDGGLRVHFLAPDGAGGEEFRVAYSVSRKVGGAVVRNRCRRRLRAIASEAADELARGSYLLVAGPEVSGLPFSELRRRVVETMRRASEGRK